MLEGDGNGRNLDMFSESVKLHGSPVRPPSHQRRVQQITDKLYRVSFHSMHSTCSKSCYVEHEMIEKPKDILRKAAYDRPQSGVARLSVVGLNRSMMVVSQRSQKT